MNTLLFRLKRYNRTIYSSKNSLRISRVSVINGLFQGYSIKNYGLMWYGFGSCYYNKELIYYVNSRTKCEITLYDGNSRYNVLSIDYYMKKYNDCTIRVTETNNSILKFECVVPQQTMRYTISSINNNAIIKIKNDVFWETINVIVNFIYNTIHIDGKLVTRDEKLIKIFKDTKIFKGYVAPNY